MEYAKKVFSLTNEFVSRKNSNGVIVLMRMDDSDIFYKIDGIAARVFSLIDGKKTVEAIAQEAKKEFSAPEERLHQDIDQFLKKLLDLKVIQ